MALFSRNKKKEEKKEEKKKIEEKREKNEERMLLEKAKLFDVILSPIITEKSSMLTSKNQYQFKVANDANKILIEKAVELIYGVKVEKVRIAKIPSKPKRLGRFSGKKPGYKKAIVTLKEGYSIEIAPK